MIPDTCPRCLSPTDGEEHCPECGSATQEPTKRPCPRCETLLSARRVADLVIDECRKCRGLFLDQIAIERVVSDREQARADALLASLPRAAAAPPAGKLYIKCPVCQVVMNRKLFATGAGVIVDVCRSHGTYFDVGELPRIIDFIAKGGLEAAEKKDRERLRQDARREKSDAATRAAPMMAEYESTMSDGSALVDLLTALFR